MPPDTESLLARELTIRDLGRVPYADAEQLQESLVQRRLAGGIPDTLLLLEHEPVITLGRRGSLSDVYLPEAELARQGIEVRCTTRGGLVTYHGPGQLVGYPILDLRALGLRLPAYVHGLEQAVIDALCSVGVQAHVDSEHVGVWTERGKIAAIGVAVRHGVSLHGFAVNLHPNLAHFGLINPCGIGELGVTSVQQITGRTVDMAAFKQTMAIVLARQLGYDGPVWLTPTDGAPARP